MKSFIKSSFLFCLVIPFIAYSQTVVTISSSGTWVVPAGVTSVKVEVWGTGGSGGGVSSSGSARGAGSGGGGGYSVATKTVVPGNSYTITIGALGAVSTGNGGNGGASIFTGTGGTVIANGGSGGAANNGVGGAGGTGIGTGAFSGGAGGAGAGNGAGGGGGAGSAGAGVSGGNAATGTGGIGSPNNAPYIGGSGGAYRNSNGAGNQGAVPGGGGGGARAGAYATNNGGVGGLGQVVLTYTINSNACSGTPPLGTAAANPTAIVCSGTSILSLSGYSTETGISYKWYSSTDNVTFDSIAGANTLTLTSPVISTTTYFYCRSTCTASGLSSNSSTTTVTVNPIAPAAPVVSAGTGATINSFNANWITSSGASTYYLDVATDIGFNNILPTYDNLNVGNVVNRTVSGLVPATTYYYRVRAFNSCGIGLSPNSNIITIATLALSYCSPTYASTGTYDFITNVSLGTLSQNTGNNVSPFYVNYTATQNAIPNLMEGVSYNLTLSFSSDANQYNGVWIDFNHNGSFEANEFFTSNTNAGSNGTAVVVILVPSGASLGNARMRIRGGDDIQPSSMQACNASNSSTGQGQDYTINVVAPIYCNGMPAPGNTASTANLICAGTTITLSFQSLPLAAGYTYQWESSVNGVNYTNISGANSTTYSTIPSTTTYYRCLVTCTNSGQSAYSTPIQVTFGINLTSTTPATRCGTGTVTLGATVNSGNIYWYTVPSGGLIIGTGSSFTTPVISSTTTYYVEGENAGCITARVAVVATVTPSPALSISGNQTICNDAVSSMSVTSSLSDYDTYIWTPTTNLYTNAAATIAYTGTSATSVYVKSTNAGTISYTCTAANAALCNNIATSSVTILPLAGVFANPTSLCFSGTSTITANPASGYGNASLQWQSSTDNISFNDIPGANGSSYSTPTISNTTYYKLQIFIGATLCSESNVATVNIINSQVSSTTPASRCGSGVVLLGGSGTGTLYWYSAASGGSSLGSGNNFNTPFITSTTTYFVEAQYSGCISTRTAVLATVNSAPAVSANASPNTICAGASIVLNASSSNTGYTYTWSPATVPFSGASVNASPVVSTVYYVTATDNSGGTNNGCYTTTTVNVTVNQTPSTVTVTPNTASMCEGGITQLMAYGSSSPNQNAASYSFTASSGTYTQLSGATVVATVKADDGFSGAIPLGFTFNYAGNLFTHVYASSNGFLSFNTAALSISANSLSFSATSMLPLIAPLWDDLDGTSVGTASYLTSGAVGSRIFTFEWLNWEWGYLANAAVISFQVKLYESDGRVQFIYNRNATNVSAGSASIGLAGSATGDFLSLNSTGTAPVASSTTETNNLSAKPASGQIYTFVLPAASLIWSPTNGLYTNASATTPYLGTATTTLYAKPNSSTTYTVTSTSGSCSNSGSTVINISTLSTDPTLISGTTSICEGSPVTLTASGGVDGSNSNFNWFAGSCGGIYTQEWFSQPYLMSGTTINSSDGILNVTSTNIDPSFTMYPIGSFSPSIYKYIQIRYRVLSGNAGGPEIFFTNSNSAVAVASQMVTGTYIADGNWHVLNIDMSTHPLWANSNITGWRFDWCTDIGVTMDVDYISLGAGLAIDQGASISITPTASTEYYVIRSGRCNITGCSNIQVNVTSIPPPGGNATQSFVYYGYVSDLVATGTAIKWYDAPTGGNLLSPSDFLNNGLIYYASQTVSGCESQTRFAVTVDIAFFKTINLHLMLEGLYNPATHMMNEVMDIYSGLPYFGMGIADKINVELFEASPPYAPIGVNINGIDLATNGLATFNISPSNTGNYYIRVSNRNHLTAWTAVPVSFNANTVDYYFTTGLYQAYGSNPQTMVSSNPVLYAFFLGDLDQGGWIDALDFNIFEIDLTIGAIGFSVSDFDGGGWVDALDFNMMEPRLMEGNYTDYPSKKK